MTDFSRYARQIILREVGVIGQQVLSDSTVLIMGLGGLGAPASLYLAGAGIGRLILCDFDAVSMNNLHRQISFRESELGRPKVEASRDQLAALNPHCEIEVLGRRLSEPELLSVVRQADVVLDCTDNFSSRFSINAACHRARKPLVSGAAIRFEGQLAVFDSARGSGCYACLYPEAGESQETCEEAGVLGPVVGVVGTRQALSAIKLLLGLGDDLGKLWVWDALRDNERRASFARDPDCRICTFEK